VISVGNLTVGGTGKTPTVRWIMERLRAAGVRPAVVLRGYGDDEVVLHRDWNPEGSVFADADRLRGARAAAAQGFDCVVLDDGFQHRRLHRDLDIVLVATGDGRRDRLLPRGPYREPWSALARADIVVRVQKGELSPGADEASQKRVRRWAPSALHVGVRMRAVGFVDLLGVATEPPSGPVVVASGVGDPEAVTRVLAESVGPGRDIEELVFPDHHAYTRADVIQLQARARDRTLVTTEKDAVKLRPFANELAGTRVLQLGPADWEGRGRLETALLDAVHGASTGPL